MAGRAARSRSPRRAQLNSKEIAQLVFAREQARLAKDWGQADNIRSQLSDEGVQLYDKTRLWKSSDGRSGRIPTFDEVEAGQVEEVEEVKAEVDTTKEEIQSLVLQREQARGNKDFNHADSIRLQLQEMGVELLDKEKLWKCPSRGLQGIITGFRNNELSDVEVHTLVTQRERARMGNDYDLSDMIRDELKNRGVTIEDKQKVWMCSDGRRGAVPSWAQIQGEVPQTLHTPGPPVQRLIPANVPVQRPSIPMAQARPRQSIEDELVSLAVAAARHPDTATRALQALRQVFSGAAPVAAPVALPAPGRPNQASSRPDGLPDMNKAKQLIRQIQESMKPVSDEEIEWLVAIRERFRMTKDYGRSDELRAELQSVGIELLEKEKRWTFDGRSGPIPLWSNIAF